MSNPAPEEIPLHLDDGETLLWQGSPVRRPPDKSALNAAANTVVTLSLAFGFFAYWMMIPDLTALQNALLVPFFILILLAVLPPVKRWRRARRFVAETRYTLTSQRAFAVGPEHGEAEHREEVIFGPDTLSYLAAAPKNTLSLWNDSSEARRTPLHFSGLEDTAVPFDILQGHQLARLWPAD
ncbi:MAG: hypothetical protein L3J37_03945 [Rhodobacteraceae bacterium]|nr:hypothetical protein [Paracoccaceae bacterium]